MKTRKARTPPSGPIRRWTVFEKQLLEKLHAEHTPWEEISRRCQHPISSCQTTLAGIRRRRRRESGDESKRMYHKKGAPGPVFTGWVPEPNHFVRDTTGKIRHTSTLIVDAELRARIEINGLSRGLMGDPLPGRSALDQLKARSQSVAEIASPAPVPAELSKLRAGRPASFVPCDAGHLSEVSAPSGRQAVLRKPQPGSAAGPGGVLAQSEVEA